MNFEDVLALIQKYQIITLYRHVRPDCDAQGSQFGLKAWLELNFPDKHVYALGSESCTQRTFPKLDTVDETVIQNSLAIVLDTGNQARIDDQRYQFAKEVIKIDHHPNVELYGTLIKVYEQAAATCEILSDFFYQMSDRYQMNTTCAEYLYSGLLTDTLCFRTANTSSHTLKMASFLTEYHIDIAGLNRTLFDQSLAAFQFANYLRQGVQIIDGGHIAYKVVTLEEQEQWNISVSDTRNFISEFGHVQEFEIWALFTEVKNDDQTIVLHGSLRSKTVQINDIAADFHGGGHKNASGVKDLSYKDMDSLLEKLANRRAEILK